MQSQRVDWFFLVFSRNASTELLLIAGEEMRDPERRNVFAWTGNSPAGRILDEEMWELILEPEGYVFKNVRFGDHIYCAADDLAFDENNRALFAWKGLSDLGREGHWKFEPAKNATQDSRTALA